MSGATSGEEPCAKCGDPRDWHGTWTLQDESRFTFHCKAIPRITVTTPGGSTGGPVCDCDGYEALPPPGQSRADAAALPFRAPEIACDHHLSFGDCLKECRECGVRLPTVTLDALRAQALRLGHVVVPQGEQQALVSAAVEALKFCEDEWPPNWPHVVNLRAALVPWVGRPEEPMREGHSLGEAAKLGR